MLNLLCTVFDLNCLPHFNYNKITRIRIMSYHTQNSTFSHNWCLTWNNPPANAIETIAAHMESGLLTYAVAGHEIAPATGTHHLQMFVQFAVRKRLQSVRKAFPGVFAEPMKSTPEAASRYCKKDGEFEEFGTLSSHSQTLQCKWRQFMELAEDGRFEEMDPGMYVRHYTTAKKLRSEIPEADNTPLSKPAGVWVWGVPGTGKTTTVTNAFEDAFLKEPNKWWDGYSAQEVVVIDEFAKDFPQDIKRLIKVWGDRLPFTGESKGISHKIRPKLVIITSNWSIDQVFTDPIDIAAMKKRYFTIKFEKYRQFTEEQLINIIENRVYEVVCPQTDELA